MLQRKEHALHPGCAPQSSVLLQFLTQFSFSLLSQCLFPNTTEDGIQSDFFPPLSTRVVKVQTGIPTPDLRTSLPSGISRHGPGAGERGCRMERDGSSAHTHRAPPPLYTKILLPPLLLTPRKHNVTGAKEPPAMPENQGLQPLRSWQLLMFHRRLQARFNHAILIRWPH